MSLSGAVKTIENQIEILMKKVKDIKSEKTEGISLLDVRSQAMIYYLQLLTWLLISKLNGKRINEKVVWELVKQRMVLEKTKPLEVKLKYQIDKLIKATQTQVQVDADLDTLDPLSFKPNPTALSKGLEAEPSQDGLYRPPRIAPTPFDDGKSTKQKLTEKIREKASKSRLLKDLQSQYDERPDDMDASGTGFNAKDSYSKLDEEWKEREAFEEENFIRLTASKKQKKEKDKLMKQGGILRFQNEFQDLAKDFQELRGVHRAVESDFAKGFGTEKAKRIEKRKNEDVDELISTMAQKRRSIKGKDQFKSSKKISKRFG